MAVIGKQQCKNCAESGGDTNNDNLVVFSDGSYCFKCAKSVFKSDIKTDPAPSGDSREILSGEFVEIPCRKINKSTCEKYGVTVKGSLIIHNFYSEGILVDQKVRDLKDKSKQWWTLSSKTDALFGASFNTPSSERSIIITEGEFDAMCLNQETGYSAVSVTKGASGAAKQIAANLEWLQQWKDVILCFDNDEAGKKATAEAIKVFEATKVSTIHLPLKDVNDMVRAGRGSELKKYIWNAEQVRKPSMVCLRDIRDKVLTKPTAGKPWPWQTMTDITFGMKLSEITVIVAGPGIGKTEFVKDILVQHIAEGAKIGIFSLEQNIEETGQRLASSYLNKLIYIPDCPDWDEKEIASVLDTFDKSVYLYDATAGILSLDKLLINLKYLKNAYGVDLFVIDNLTALCANPYIDGKRISQDKYVGEVMSALQQITRQLRIHIMIVAHTNTDQIQLTRSMGSSKAAVDAVLGRSAEEMNALTNPAGSTWENGRMPNTSHILGSKNTARLADHVVALARNLEATDDLVRRTLKVKFLKTGRKNPRQKARSFDLLYNLDTGKLEEI